MADRHSSRRSHSQRVHEQQSASRNRHSAPSGSYRGSTRGSGSGGTRFFDQDQFNGRLGWVLVIFLAVAAILALRLVWLQVIDAQNNLDRGTSREVTVDIEPRRGTIYDRNGTILATTVDAYNIFWHPHVVSADKVDQLAQALANTCGGKAQDYKEKIQQDTNFVYLFKGADENAMNVIKDLGIDGVDYEKTSKRVYPCGAMREALPAKERFPAESIETGSTDKVIVSVLIPAFILSFSSA